MNVNQEDEIHDQIRSADEVARRCIVLYAVIAVGHGEPRNELVAWLRREGLWNAVSPKESAFLLTEPPTPQQRIDATWRAEALFPLLWSLRLIERLPSPVELCDVQMIRKVLPQLLSSVADFIATANLRSETEIHAANEEIYQIHWQIRDKQLRSNPVSTESLPRMPTDAPALPPVPYDEGVVQERHTALNWLIGYCGQAWDDIATDT